MQFNLVRSCIS